MIASLDAAPLLATEESMSNELSRKRRGFILLAVLVCSPLVLLLLGGVIFVLATAGY